MSSKLYCIFWKHISFAPGMFAQEIFINPMKSLIGVTSFKIRDKIRDKKKDNISFFLLLKLALLYFFFFHRKRWWVNTKVFCILKMILFCFSTENMIEIWTIMYYSSASQRCWKPCFFLLSVMLLEYNSCMYLQNVTLVFL